MMPGWRSVGLLGHVGLLGTKENKQKDMYFGLDSLYA